MRESNNATADEILGATNMIPLGTLLLLHQDKIVCKKMINKYSCHELCACDMTCSLDYHSDYKELTSNQVRVTCYTFLSLNKILNNEI